MGLLKAQTKKNTIHKKLAGEECAGEETHSMPMLRLWFPDGSKTLLPKELIPRPTRVATLSIVYATSYPSLGSFLPIQEHQRPCTAKNRPKQSTRGNKYS